MTTEEKTIQQEDSSFLTEDQLEGKAKGEINIDDLNEAIENVSHILNDEAAQVYKTEAEEKWPTCKISVYNHELKQIVPAGIGQTLRGNPRTVCGLTGSKKISIGREDALRSYYNIKNVPKADTLEEALKEEEKHKKPIQKKTKSKQKSKSKQ